MCRVEATGTFVILPDRSLVIMSVAHGMEQVVDEYYVCAKNDTARENMRLAANAAANNPAPHDSSEYGPHEEAGVQAEDTEWTLMRKSTQMTSCICAVGDELFTAKILGEPFKQYDVAFFSCDNLGEAARRAARNAAFQLKSPPLTAVLGNTAYWAGFPFGVKHVVCERGLVSSDFTEGGIEFCAVTGTVLPGNSGSVVVVVIDGDPCVIGLLDAQFGEYAEEMAALEENLALIREPIEFAGRLGFVSMFKVVLGAVQRNVSSGLGRVVRIEQLLGPLRGEAPRVRNAQECAELAGLVMPIGRSAATVAGSFKLGNVIVAYVELKWCKSRGIRVYCKGAFDSRFKLNPNPHKCKKYNKRQAEFYEELATAIVGDTPLSEGAAASTLLTVGSTVEVFGVTYTLDSR